MSKRIFFKIGLLLAGVQGFAVDTTGAQCGVVLDAEVLFLKPSIEQSSFVISSANRVVAGEFYPEGTRHLNTSGYKPGFRLEAFTELCPCWSTLEARFTYLDAGFGETVSGPVLIDTIGYTGDGAQVPEDTFYSGSAKIHDHFRYFAFDFTFNRALLSSCRDKLLMLIGLQYVNIQHNRKFRSDGVFVDEDNPRIVANKLNSTSHFWGIGPELGLDYEYLVCGSRLCGGAFSLEGNARGSLLCTRATTHFHYSALRTVTDPVVAVFPVSVDLDNDPAHWRVNPAFAIQLSGVYQFSCRCVDLFIEAGYEWMWYADCVDAITNYDTPYPGESLDIYNNLSLQGPFVTVGVIY